jgi:membrane-bound inhibitor of C-type lysozyme
MDDPEIQQRVNELDAAVTKDGSKLLIYVDPDHGNCAFVANRKGYLRAGIEMLRAAIVPLAAHESTTPIDIKYLCGERGLRVDKLERGRISTQRVFLRAGRVCCSAHVSA